MSKELNKKSITKNYAFLAVMLAAMVPLIGSRRRHAGPPLWVFLGRLSDCFLGPDKPVPISLRPWDRGPDDPFFGT